VGLQDTNLLYFVINHQVFASPGKGIFSDFIWAEYQPVAQFPPFPDELHGG
jgi:hypothetical protein